MRSHLKHGQFDLWLKAEFGWSRRTAYNFISIYETFDESATVAQINATTSALYLMAAPSTSATICSELLERERQGERITREIVREAVRQERSTQIEKRQKSGDAALLTKTSATSSGLQKQPTVSPEVAFPKAMSERSAPEIITFIPKGAQALHQVHPEGIS